MIKKSKLMVDSEPSLKLGLDEGDDTADTEGEAEPQDMQEEKEEDKSLRGDYLKLKTASGLIIEMGSERVSIIELEKLLFEILNKIVSIDSTLKKEKKGQIAYCG